MSVGAGPSDGVLVSEDAGGDHGDRFRHHGIDFAGHDGGAGLGGRKGDFADGATGAGAEETDVVGDFEKAGGDGVELAVGFDEGVFGGLRFEVIFGFDKIDAAFLRDDGDRLFREVGMAVESGADGGATEGKLEDGVEGFVGTVERALDLFGEAGELLTETNRGGVHHVGAADFENVVEFVRLLDEGFVKAFEGGDEEILEGHSGGDVHRGGEGVVGGLALVDVVVGVDAAIGIDLLGAVGDDLVGVHVGRGAGTGLVGIDGEVLVVLAFEDFARGLLDDGGFFGIDDAEFAIGAGGGELDETVSMHHERIDGAVGDGKVENGALGGGSVEGFNGDGHFAHGIAFDACFRHGDKRPERRDQSRDRTEVFLRKFAKAVTLFACLDSNGGLNRFHAISDFGCDLLGCGASCGLCGGGEGGSCAGCGGKEVGWL